MPRWLLHTDPHTESVWFNPETEQLTDDGRPGLLVEDGWRFLGARVRRPGTRQPLVSGRPGVLAAAVLGSLKKPKARDRARGTQLLVRAGVSRRTIRAMSDWRRFSEAVTAIRRQLVQWFTDGRVRWHPLYSGLEDDDRPAPEIPTALMEHIHWRSPSDVVLDSFGAAVLVSAMNGVFARTLYACAECRELMTRDTRGPSLRRRRCDTCKLRWHRAGRKNAGRVNVTVRRVTDRARHQDKTNEERLAIANAIRRIKADRRLSVDAIIRQLEGLVPRSPRGRPRTKG